MRFAVFIVCITAGCSTRVPEWPPFPTVWCHADVCPGDDDLALAFGIAADVDPDLDPAPRIEADWRARGDLFEMADGRMVAGYSENENAVAVTGWGVLFHERMHAHFWEVADDGDADHAAGDGPWTTATDDAVAQMTQAWAGYMDTLTCDERAAMADDRGCADGALSGADAADVP
jgi:hypothetical protein